MAGKKRSDLDQREPVVFDSTVLTRNAVAGVETMPVPGRHATKSGKWDNAVLLNGSTTSLVK
jgi:hypothetical protein